MRVLRRRSGRLAAAVVMAAALAGVSLVSIPAASAAGETQTLGNASANEHCDAVSNGGHFNVLQLSSTNSYEAPGDGFLTSWSFDSGPADSGVGSTTAQLQVWRGSFPTYTLVFQSDPQTADAGTGVHTYTLDPPANVEKGDVIGVGLTVSDGFCLDLHGETDDWAQNFSAVSTGDSATFTDGPDQYDCCWGTVNVSAEFASSFLDVVKLVSGSPTPGTVFTEHVECEGADNPVVASPNTDVDVDLFFDEHGAPTLGTDPDIPIVGPTTCTVTETVTGGAISVLYECDHFYPGESIGTESGCPGPHRGPSDDPSYSGTVSLEGGDVGTITVINGFVHFPPDGGPNGTPNTIPRPVPFPTPTTTQPVTPVQPSTPAAAVTAAPRFTG